MLIIGHRGCAGLVTENTIGSFQKAQELGVDMVETDLRLSKDGRIVLSHNPLKKNKSQKFVELDELLRMTKVPLNLEIKERGFEELLLKKLKKFSGKVLISSFQIRILKKIRTLDEKIPLGLLISPKMGRFIQVVLKFTKGLNLYSIHPAVSITNTKNVMRLRKMKVKIYPYTVNTLQQFEKLKQLEVDGVFTDFPNLIKN